MENSDIDNIKDRISIDEVISEYIKLTKAGSGLTALCPFHSEKSPSFHVSPDRGIYKCFGCGESGDIFSFVQKFENMEFPEVKKKLAKKAGVVLQDFAAQNPAEKKEAIEKKQREQKLMDLLDEATQFFHLQLLKNESAKKYLKKRGVDEAMAKKFRLGFALDSWNGLEDFLKQKGYTQDDMLQVGLVKKNEKGKVYDRFRNRVMFPIFDEKGAPVAFSGRDFSGLDNTAKYLNSPQTDFFDKSDILFGFNFAKIEARKRKYFILVEGQMDLVMNHKVGFENTVASSGTSLTEQHLKKMALFSKNLIFAFDSDKAGVEAAFRGIQKALALDFDVKILDIPNDADPADIILDDQNKWKEIVTDSKNVIDFYIKKIVQSEQSLKEKIASMEEKILPFVAHIKNPIEKGKYISKISEGFEVQQEFVIEALKVAESKSIAEEREEEIRVRLVSERFDIFSKNNIIVETKKKILKQLSSIYYWQKNLRTSEPWVDPQIVLNIIEKNSTEEVFEKIVGLESNEEYVNSLIFEVEVLYGLKDKHALEYDIQSMQSRLGRVSQDEEIAFLQKKIDLCEGEERKNILKRIQDITKEQDGG